MSDSLTIEENKSLATFTSWLVGGAAEYYCAPKTLDELGRAIQWAAQQNQTITVLGGGTNVLISDQGVSGLLIHTVHLNRINQSEQGGFLVLDVECGTPKSEVLKIFLKHRLEPAIFLAGLPGDMAGGVVMNAGVGHKTNPREFHEIVQSIQTLSLNDQGEVETKEFQNSDIQWSYRKSQNWRPGLISRVRVSWPNEPCDAVLQQVREGNKRRKNTQPLNLPSCGSVFKNPEGDHSGRLIEASGLKGYTLGGAQVSEKHANFIVNQGGATAQQIHQLIEHVQQTVWQKQSVRLTNEVVYLGHWPSR